jgi:hypothetical protein
MPTHFIIALNRQESEHYRHRREDRFTAVIVTGAEAGLMRLRGYKITANDTVDFVGKWHQGEHAHLIEAALRSRGWTGFVLDPVLRARRGCRKST